jgi:zinc D-Ala-D-Ala carboxypeptidase
MKLTPNFSLAEFIASNTAARRGLNNDLPASLYANARATCEMLERIRAFLSERLGRPAPILLTSGYRSIPVNRAVGSKDTSSHTRALAADWHCPAVGRPTDVCRMLEPHVETLGIGQLINEFPSASGGWIHTAAESVPERNRIITITARGVRQGVHDA